MSSYPTVRPEGHRSTFSMLLQAIKCASLETHEDFCIGSFNLTVALRMRNRRIAYMNA
jgi:hypothetical protein